MRARRIRAAAAAALSVLLLAGCGAERAGTASIAGDQVVTDQQVTDTLDELIDQIGAQNVDVAQATPSIVTRLTQQTVVAEAARREGVVVTDTDVAKLLQDTAKQSSTDRAGIDNALAQQWVPSSQVESYARLYLEQQKLAAKLGPGTSDQGAAALKTYVAKVSADLGVRVAPRYGVWDDASLALGPGPTDLAAPAPSPSPSS